MRLCAAICREKILRRMNTCVTRGTGRKADVVFYDVTNFFFEIPDADPDVETEVVGADGSKAKVTVKGLRKFGVSKENRRQPIVQAGLFLDDQGIPLSIDEGNARDPARLRAHARAHPGDCYRMQDATGDDIRAILKAYGIEIQSRIYAKGEIREIKSTVKPV